MKRLGVFIVGGDEAIPGGVDIEKAVEAISALPGVEFVGRHPDLTAEDGVDYLVNAIGEKSLEALVIAMPEPRYLGSMFVPLARQLGIAFSDCRGFGLGEVDDPARAVKDLVEEIQGAGPVETGISRRALVIGGGISGIQAALDIAEAGYQVTLVEREPSIGGHMIQLSETFPTLDCSQCILTPKMVECGRHPNIELLAYSEVKEISGEPGSFKVKITKKPRYVEEDKCNACGDCVADCPVVVTDQFNTGLSWRKAIYSPFPQAVPSYYTLDAEHCLGLFPIACGKCEEACLPGAINYDQKPKILERDVGAVIIATGFDLFTHANVGEYGYGHIADVINGLQFERLLSASGPTMGAIRRPSDGKTPKEVVFIQCVRSRDPERGVPYCSKICCMYTAKHAMLYKHRVPDGQTYVFYMDIRAGGKGYEEFVQRATERDGVMYLRGRVSRVFEEDGKVMVWGADTLTGRRIEIAADLVVLATAIVPNDGSDLLNEVIAAETDDSGFLKEAHLKIRPMDSPRPGFFLAGAAQGPKDIPECVAQASGAASKVCAFFAGLSEADEPEKVEEATVGSETAP